MDAQEYRKRGKEMVDYIADYLESVRERRVFPDVRPGYMRSLVPTEAPMDGESWGEIIGDVERVVMPGVTHWQSPYMHAYFPALNSYPSLLGDMLADGINCLGFTWASSPACTELEMIVMDWLAKMIGLPEDFMHSKPHSIGGGVIQTTASESTFVCLLAARTEAIRRYQNAFPEVADADINSRLVAYCSDQAHSSVEKAGLIGLVKIRYIESDDKLSLRGDKLKEAIAYDRENGLIPFYLCATLGTTGACSFDNLVELGPICKEEEMWLHIDAAYAGSAFVCPEFRKWMEGIEYADSLAFNPSKWLMVHFDCTAMWVRNSRSLHRTFNVDPLYLQHENSGLAIDYMHWQVPLSKRFRALKLWFVIRNYGIKGLQQHIRQGVRLAQKFESLVRSDDRFEIAAARHLGMVVFRLKGDNSLTEQLLKRLNSSGKMHAVPAMLKGNYVIRFTVTSARTTANDIARDWQVIRESSADIVPLPEGAAAAMPVLEGAEEKAPPRVKISLKDIKERNASFGTSLLLANIGPNSPMTPKIVNGSHLALVEDRNTDFSKKIEHMKREIEGQGSAVRRLIMSGTRPNKKKRLEMQLEQRAMSVWGPRIPPTIGTRTQKSLMGLKQFSLDATGVDEEDEDADSSPDEHRHIGRSFKCKGNKKKSSYSAEEVGKILAMMELEESTGKRKELAERLKDIISQA